MTVEVTRYDGGVEGAAAAFAAIYEESFPASERDATDDLLASIEAGRRDGYVASEDGVTVGMAVVLRLEGPPVAFLEYIAVDPRRRSRGIGADMLRQLRLELGGLAGILLELEPPEGASGEERVTRERRLDFYLRNGAAIVDCAPRFRAPNLERPDEQIAFTLVWLPLAREGEPPPSGPFLRESVAAILTQSYELDAADPLVAEVVADLAC
jgi:GNAT superfamily N-acetyltransferase